MKIVNVIGGLGNQMFQYAFYLSLKYKFKEEIKLDVTSFENYDLHNGNELENIFKMNASYANLKEKKEVTNDGDNRFFQRLKRKLLLDKKRVIERDADQFYFKNLSYGLPNKDLFYRGYWQSYKYFEPIAELVKAQFTFPELTDKKNLDLVKRINNQQSVSLHVRRGDYIDHPLLGNICTLSYYQNALSLVNKKIENPLIIVFSNDINWCKSNLKLIDAEYVDWNSGKNSFKDMQLMSLCDHNIIANSSFSWWGAWLNTNPNKIVVAPTKWIKDLKCLNDLIPSDWFKI